jgi:hypothetical protein
VKDGDFLAKGIDVNSYIEAARTKQNTKSSIHAKTIMDGGSHLDVMREDPGFYMMNMKKIKDFEAEVRLTGQKKEGDWNAFIQAGIDRDLLLRDDIRVFIHWLYENIKVKREFKGRQLFLRGDTNWGKTSFFRVCEKMLRIYWLPMDEEFYDEWRDNFYDLVVLDEFKACKKIRWLNKFLDGQTMYMRQKGSQAVKTQNVPVVILSNYTLDECYDKASAKGDAGYLALRERLLELELDGPIYDGMAE